jgi:hypothetical protein
MKQKYRWLIFQLIGTVCEIGGYSLLCYQTNWKVMSAVILCVLGNNIHLHKKPE